MSKSKKRRAPEPEVRKFRKKTSILTYEGITYVDYKDVNLLRKFMSERAKIRQRRVTGNSQKQQREVARAIRVAREMALLPFNVRQVTSKTKKRRDRDDEEATLDSVERAKEQKEQKRAAKEQSKAAKTVEAPKVETSQQDAVETVAAEQEA